MASPREAHHAGMYDVFQKNPGVDGKRNANAADAKDFQKYGIEGATVVLGSVLLGMVLCCVVRLWRKRRRRLAAASQAWPDTSSYPSRPDNWTSHQSTPESRTRRQQPPPVPGKPARLPWSTEGQARASPASHPARPPPARPQWLSYSPSRLLWDQPSALQDPEELKPSAHPASAWPRSSCKRLRWPQQACRGADGGERTGHAAFLLDTSLRQPQKKRCKQEPTEEAMLSLPGQPADASRAPARVSWLVLAGAEELLSSGESSMPTAMSCKESCAKVLPFPPERT
ncbi:uncharacterized protein LOC121233092 [Aquila chrysaetos chrysaetos]|uniref:uncharacterized protein LOC121233092 n=1 Tax=Aquila chrysaetos chrysaetos TaxID=223781 RepID=UPI001B7D2C85|nr:uncharacterized protein LOC121233092 [Aquila chrysaetos chrysaetos]